MTEMIWRLVSLWMEHQHRVSVREAFAAESKG